ncbi:glyoxalase [Tersicoccus solisilvae]|uniref:Glyoxalase n=1 Tax=Tersicoccus solisilvae TaxID=1882339 RepID=A0ABQ1PDD6_9MICC|nr:VOC family protein [Tersicoccus solisilvae]GGC95052.1 glyoxalase [Tersicoccus solisilvae]
MKLQVNDRLPDDTAMGVLTLRAGDLPALVGYYQAALGLTEVASDADGVLLGRGGAGLVRITDGHGLRLPSRSEAGLFHTALLFEDRSQLADTVAAALRRPEGRYVGAQDHAVSQAFYFQDPENNGIELYWDRPREAWHWQHDAVHMTVDPLDGRAFLDEHVRHDEPQADPATVGHVHLQVGDVATAHDFYVGALGFAATARLGETALFVSAGGYHHHMAMNVWNSAGAGPRRDTLGLGRVEIAVPSDADVAALREQLDAAGIPVAVQDHGRGNALVFADPWRNELRVAAA